MKWEGNVARVCDMKNSTYIQNVGRKSFRRPSCRRENNIKMDRKKQALNGELDLSGTEQGPVASQQLRGGTEEDARTRQQQC
jgi:hypothetical protein